MRLDLDDSRRDRWVLIASGPSLTKEDCDLVRSYADDFTVGVINNSVLWAPWADILYSCDPSWWRHEAYLPLWQSFHGHRVGRFTKRSEFPAGVTVYPADESGAILGREKLANGNNSGYQLCNLAALEGAKFLVLLGFDMQYGAKGERHHHADHPRPLGNFSPGVPDLCIRNFGYLASALPALNIEVINATRTTALRCFNRMPLEKALSRLKRKRRMP